MDCSPPGSSVHGILQARILEWVAMPFSKGSSWPRDWTWISWVSCIGRQILYHCATWEANTYPCSFQRPHRFTAHTPSSRARANIWSEQCGDLPPSTGKPHILTLLLSPSLGTSVLQVLFVACVCVCVCVCVKDTEEMEMEIKVWEREFIIIFLWFPVAISSAAIFPKTQQHCGRQSMCPPLGRPVPDEQGLRTMCCLQTQPFSSSHNM